MTTDISGNLAESIAFIREHVEETPSLALVLGSGLGDFADSLDNRRSLSTASIPHYPRSTVEGHKGQIVFGKLDGRPVMAFQGRSHFYESNNVQSVLYPISIAALVGVTTVVTTNAAGGINRRFEPGDLMIISDQINLTFETHRSWSLRGKPALYSAELSRNLEETARTLGITLRKGVYAGVKGPSYETAAEVEMIRRLGGDAVGMSTVLETGHAVSLGLSVIGISCITNYATGITSRKLTHQEVTEVGQRVKEIFGQLLRGTCQLL